MLDRMLANALEGLTVIEDEMGAVGQILANQMGTYAEAAGKRVGHLSFSGGNLSSLGDGSPSWRGSSEDDSLATGRTQSGAQLFQVEPRYVARDDAEYDLLVVEGLSVYLYDKTVREVVDVVRRLVDRTRMKRSFIVTLEKTLVGEKTASYLKARADSVIVVRTEVSADRVLRSLFVQKIRGTFPSDKLIKFSLDGNGIQVDTREFLG